MLTWLKLRLNEMHEDGYYLLIGVLIITCFLLALGCFRIMILRWIGI